MHSVQLRNLFKLICKSALAKDAFQVCGLALHPGLSTKAREPNMAWLPILDVPTQWYSTFLMLDQSIEACLLLNQILMLYNIDRPCSVILQWNKHVVQGKDYRKYEISQEGWKQPPGGIKMAETLLHSYKIYVIIKSSHFVIHISSFLTCKQL